MGEHVSLTSLPHLEMIGRLCRIRKRLFIAILMEDFFLFLSLYFAHAEATQGRRRRTTGLRGGRGGANVSRNI